MVRRADAGLGATAAGGTSGSFAPHLRDRADPPAPEQGRFGSAAEFLFALDVLDRELASLVLPQQMRINAVGGFALMCHKLRENGYTMDIDTITSDFGHEVRDAINRVAADLSLERDWINNEAAGNDPEQVSNMIDAMYIRQDFGFRNIEVNVADLGTLTRAKAFAVSDSSLSGRTRDWDDLLDLLERQGISSISQFAEGFPQVHSWEYPQVHQALAQYFATGSRNVEITEEDLDVEALLRELGTAEGDGHMDW